MLGLLPALAVAMAHRAPRLVVDAKDAPLVMGDRWSCARGTTHLPGAVLFTLHDADTEEVFGTARLVAGLGLPSDALSAAHADLLPSLRTWELFDVETEPQHRRQGYASILLDGLCSWLRLHYKDTPCLFARDASDIADLYSKWGFDATDPEYPHVWVADVRAVGASLRKRRAARSQQ